jgi:hypothetical protein
MLVLRKRHTYCVSLLIDSTPPPPQYHAFISQLRICGEGNFNCLEARQQVTSHANMKCFKLMQKEKNLIYPTYRFV